MKYELAPHQDHLGSRHVDEFASYCCAFYDSTRRMEATQISSSQRPGVLALTVQAAARKSYVKEYRSISFAACQYSTVVG